jgi:hypothetical protein
MTWHEKVADLTEWVAYVMGCAPDHFPYEDYIGAHQQLDLERAFAELRSKLTEVANDHETPEIAQCGVIFEQAYEIYQRGERIPGMQKLEEAYHILLAI